jgi:hypothetical protein
LRGEAWDGLPHDPPEVVQEVKRRVKGHVAAGRSSTNAGKQRWGRHLKSRFVIDSCLASVFFVHVDNDIASLEFAPVKNNKQSKGSF